MRSLLLELDESTGTVITEGVRSEDCIWRKDSWSRGELVSSGPVIFTPIKLSIVTTYRQIVTLNDQNELIQSEVKRV